MESVECFILHPMSPLSEGEGWDVEQKKTNITIYMKSETRQAVHILAWL